MRTIIFNGEYYATLKKPSGIGRYTFEILRELDRLVQPGQVVILAPKCDYAPYAFRNIRFQTIGSFGKNEKQEKVFGRIWKHIIFPTFCMFHHAFTVNTGVPTWKHYKFDAISIYDCMPERFYQDSDYEAELDRVGQLIQNQKNKTAECKFIITDSLCAKADICSIYQVSEERVEVIPCGWQHFERINEDIEILTKLGLRREEYFFTLGNRMPHKNTKWVTSAARKNPQYTFVITGSRQGRTDTSFEGEITDNMIFTGFLKDEEIKALMHYCKAFIHPSLFEGFGMPPLEAMSTGANCIVSNVTSLPEVYKNSVWYIDPYDYENIDLDEIMSRPKESNDLILNEYSWEKSAKLLLDVLQKWAK